MSTGNLSNVTSSDFSPSPAIYVLVVVVSLTAIASLLGNLLVHVAFWRTKTLKASPPAVLVMVLAFVDFCMAIFVMPFVVITSLHDGWSLSSEVCVASGFMNTFLTAIQFGVLFIISINRFMAISNPLYYRVKWTIKITNVMIGVVFWHSLFWSIMPFIGWGGYDFIPGTLYCNINWSEHKAHSTTLFACCYIIPAVIGAILYIIVYIKILRMAKSPIAIIRRNQKDLRAAKVVKDCDMKGKKMHESSLSINSTAGQSPQYKSRESRITKSLLIVAAAFAMFWLPRGVVNFWAVISGRDSVPKSLEYLTTVFIFMNSFVNPIIYGVFHYEYNNAFRDILRFKNRRASGETE